MHLWLRITLSIVLALHMAACAKKDPQVEKLIGSEPQRLSFGPPPEVLRSFVGKMKQCWFSGSKATLAGYHYEAGEAAGGEDSAGADETYQNVKVFGDGQAVELFEIQFHKYNDNTLIVTRNVSASPELLTKLKRDIQLWAFNSPDCNEP